MLFWCITVKSFSFISKIARFVLRVSQKHKRYFLQHRRKKIQENEKKKSSQTNILNYFQINLVILSFRWSCFETFRTRLLSEKRYIYVIFKRMQILSQFLLIYFRYFYSYFRNPCTRRQCQRQPYTDVPPEVKNTGISHYECVMELPSLVLPLTWTPLSSRPWEPQNIFTLIDKTFITFVVFIWVRKISNFYYCMLTNWQPRAHPYQSLACWPRN